MAESVQNFCVLELDGWETWWQDTRSGSVKAYVSIVIFFLSAVLAHPIARSIFFVLRRVTPGKWRCVLFSFPARACVCHVGTSSGG